MLRPVTNEETKDWARLESLYSIMLVCGIGGVKSNTDQSEAKSEGNCQSSGVILARKGGNELRKRE